MKQLFFISDLHLGAGYSNDIERAALFDKFADYLIKTNSKLYLLGDFFDFWVEHPSFIRKEYFQVLITLQKLQKANITVTLVCGNHDFMGTSFLEELGVQVIRGKYTFSYNEKKVYLCHGDDFNKDLPHKIVNGILRNRLCQKLFLLLPAEWALRLASGTSRGSRKKSGGVASQPPKSKHQWYLEEVEKRIIEQNLDLICMGHVHIAELTKFPQGIYGNCGTWLQRATALSLEENTLTLMEINSKGIPDTIIKQLEI